MCLKGHLFSCLLSGSDLPQRKIYSISEHLLKWINRRTILNVGFIYIYNYLYSFSSLSVPFPEVFLLQNGRRITLQKSAGFIKMNGQGRIELVCGGQVCYFGWTFIHESISKNADMAGSMEMTPSLSEQTGKEKKTLLML